MTAGAEPTHWRGPTEPTEWRGFEYPSIVWLDEMLFNGPQRNEPAPKRNPLAFGSTLTPRMTKAKTVSRRKNKAASKARKKGK